MTTKTTMIALMTLVACEGDLAPVEQATIEPQLIAAFVEACPSFAEPWDQYVRATPVEDRSGYNDIAVFAHHVVSLQRSGAIAELPAIFSVAEETLKSGDETNRDLVSIGLFGDIQNITSHTPESGGPAGFTGYLGPTSLREWKAIDEKWAAAGAAAERSGRPPALSIEQYQQTESDELRRLIQVTSRRLPSGRIVTMGDVIRWEATNEERPADVPRVGSAP
jgi:hypothetical protein